MCASLTHEWPVVQHILIREESTEGFPNEFQRLSRPVGLGLGLLVRAEQEIEQLVQER